MANVVGDIAIRIGADVAPLILDLGKAEAQIKRFGGTAETAGAVGMRTMSLAGTALAGAAVAAGVGIVALTKASMENLDTMSKASRTMGIHVSDLQAMAQVASEAGIQLDTLTGGMTKMQNSIAGLLQGTSTQIEAFGRLGLSVRDLQNLGADEQFALIAERIDAMQDPALRTAAAMDIFGKSGAALLPMMESYRSALSDVAQYQRDMNLAVSDEQAAAVEAANDAMDRMAGSAVSLGNALSIALAPLITEVAEKITDLVGALTWAQTHINDNAIAMTLQDAADAASDLTMEAGQAAIALQGVGDGKISAALWDQVRAIDAAKKDFADGKISVQEYRDKLLLATETIKLLYQKAQELDGTDMSGAIEGMTLFGNKISIALTAAMQLAGVLPKLGGVTPLMHPRSTAPGASTGMNFPDYVTGPNGLPIRSNGAIPSGLMTPPTVPDGSTGGGGGGGGGSAGDPNAALKDQLAAMQEAFASEAELADQKYAERLAQIKAFREAKLEIEGSYDDLESAARKEHEEALARIQQEAIAAKFNAVSGAFGDLSSLMNTHNKKLFEVGKAASLSQAVIDGFTSASAAWSKGMQIGGPPVAFAFTAASLAKTGAIIAGIRSTQFGGGASAPSLGGTGSGGASGAAGGGVANITLVGDMFSRASVEDLFKQINNGLRQGYQINLVGA